MSKKSLTTKVVDPYVIGIDLGTTNSVVSIIKDKIPIILKNNLAKNTTPSIVRLGDHELIGEEAQPFLAQDPQNTIFSSKRLIGRKFNDPNIQEYIKSLPYKTQAVCNGDVWIKTDFGKFSPVQIGAKILNKLREFSEKHLNHPIQRAVVTVPAYFDDSQRQATKDAGKIAKLDIVRIINEPTAAALAYGLDKKEQGHIAVYDLGGGTFDVSILELNDGIFHVKATNGNTFLGGEDFDNELVKFLLRMYEQEEGINLDQNSSAVQKIKKSAEEAKKELSTKLNTRIFIENIVPGHDFDLRLKREQLESVIKRIAQRTIEPCQKAIKDAKINKTEIKHVILVGGMTKMPYIRQLVKDVFGIEPYTNIDPDEAVAKGAAIQAGILSGSMENILLLDVTPLTLGIEVLGGIFSKIVDRNTTVPFKHTETFSTSEDNQEEVDIKIYQGERPMAADNRLLGSLKLRSIPKAARGKPQINVTFEADANGIIKVMAEDSVSKKVHTVELSPDGGLTDKEVENMIKEAEEKKEQDRFKEKKAQFKVETMGFINEIEKTKLPEKIIESFRDLKKFIKNDDFDIKKAETMLIELKKIV